MGFLQHDTNNIIVDTVLTDLGRQFLARNDGSFSIVKFAVGDDEVDYTLIQQFGRTVGKEKIEKNTPIFEALTNQNYAQKYRLVSVSNPNLIRLPNLTITGQVTSNIITIGNTKDKRRTVTVYQTIIDETAIDTELQDQTYIVQMDNKFLQLVDTMADNIDGQNMATYLVKQSGTLTSVGGTQATLNLSTKAILETQFQIYGARSNKNQINTFMKISGAQSGAVLEIEVQISKTL